MVDKKFIAIETRTMQEALKAFDVLRYEDIWATTRNRLSKGKSSEEYPYLIFDVDQWTGSPDSDDRMVVNPFNPDLEQITWFKHMFGRRVLLNGVEMIWSEEQARINKGEFTPKIIIKKRKKNEK